MKNTVKKILALVFVVAMVCSLAVPVFANETLKVKVYVYPVDGTTAPTAGVEVDLTNVKTQTVEQALKGISSVSIHATTGKLTGVGTLKNTDDAVLGEFGTGAFVVTLNGKIVSEDLGNISVANGDKIVVYWNDSTFPAALAQYDASNIDAGVISFYYYDAEGNKQPLVGANVELNVKNLLKVTDSTPLAPTAKVETDAENGLPTNNTYDYDFTTDEKGQIWIAPQYLDGKDDAGNPFNIVVVSVDWAPEKLEKGDMTKDEFNYYKQIYESELLFVGDQLDNTSIEIADQYTVAGATGDMTVVYVMVAAVAVITLGAVVIMKKKAVKAN